MLTGNLPISLLRSSRHVSPSSIGPFPSLPFPSLLFPFRPVPPSRFPPCSAAVPSGLPPSSSAASAPIDPPKGGGFSGVFGGLKALGVPTTGDSTGGGGEAGKEEKAEEQEQEQKPLEKKKSFGGSAVSRLRQMFERNNSDSKKKASLEARPLRRPVTSLAAASLGERKPVVGQTAAAEPVKIAANVEFAAVDADANGAKKGPDEHPAAGANGAGTAPVAALEGATDAGPALFPAAAEGAPSATGILSAQGGGSELKWPALRQPVPDTRTHADKVSSAKAPGQPYVAAARATKLSSEEAPKSKPYVGAAEMPMPAVNEGKHVPTEDMMPAPTEDFAPAKPAVKAPKFGASLQSLFFGSAKEKETPKVPAFSGGGPVPSSETPAEGGVEDSPAAKVMAMGLSGAEQRQRASELPVAARGGPANNTNTNTNTGIAGDMTPLAGVVPTEGGMNIPAALRSSDDSSSAPAPAPALDMDAPPRFDASLALESVPSASGEHVGFVSTVVEDGFAIPTDGGGGRAPDGDKPVANRTSAFTDATPEMSVAGSRDNAQLDLGSPPGYAEEKSLPAVVSSPAAGVGGATTTVDQVSLVEGGGMEQPGGLAVEQGAAVAGVVEGTAVFAQDAAVGVPGLLEPSPAVPSEAVVPEVDAVVSAGVEATEAACAAGDEVADDDGTAKEASARIVCADDPTAVSLEHKVCLLVGDTTVRSLELCCCRVVFVVQPAIGNTVDQSPTKHVGRHV